MQKNKFYTILASLWLAGAAFAAESMFDEYRAWPEGDNGGVVYEQDFATGDLAVFTSYQGYEIGKWGYNGSPGLRAERKPGDALAKTAARTRLAQSMSFNSAFQITADWLDNVDKVSDMIIEGKVRTF